MATITREKVMEINNGAKNGYKLDVQAYVCYGSKKLKKYVKLNDVDYLKFSVSFNQYDNNNNPQIRVDYQKSEGDFMVSRSGNFSKTLTVVDVCPKTKQVKILQQITEHLTEEFEKNMISAYENCSTKHSETDIFSAFAREKAQSSTILLNDLKNAK